MLGLSVAGAARQDGPACPPPDQPPLTASRGEDARVLLRQCVRGELRRGAWDEADRRIRAAREAYVSGLSSAGRGATGSGAREAWHDLLDRLTATRIVDARAWTRAPELAGPLRERTPWLASMVTGLATARLAWRTQDAAAFDRVLETARALAAQGEASGDLEIVRAARLVQAAVAGGQYERDEMQLLLDEADATETALRHTLGDAYVPVVIARELEADLLLQTDRYAAAVTAYEAVIAAHPWRVQPWLGLAAAHERLGHSAEAARCREVAAAIAPGFTFEPTDGPAARP